MTRKGVEFSAPLQKKKKKTVHTVLDLIRFVANFEIVYYMPKTNTYSSSYGLRKGIILIIHNHPTSYLHVLKLSEVKKLFTLSHPIF